MVGNFERVFDRLIEILAQNEGVFRPVLPENLGKTPRNGSIGAPHRHWPMPIDQLVEIPGGELASPVCDGWYRHLVPSCRQRVLL
jgi:hypothetical protein